MITQLTYNLCLLYTKNNSSDKFEIIGFQADNTLFLSNKIFIVNKEEQLHKANVLAKKREKLEKKPLNSIIVVLSASLM